MPCESLNILFFLPDQHRRDWLGVNTALPLRTPHLDALARRGVRFEKAYCPSPLCAPSRACLASGKSYEWCGVVNNDDNYPLDLPTYYQSLRDLGYRVAGVGKFDLHKGLADPANLDWHLDGSRLLDAWGFTEGIDNEGKLDGSNAYRIHNGPRGPYLAFLEERGLARAYVHEHNVRAEHMGAYTTALPDDVYCDNWVAENGLRFLREFPTEQPWHLVINFTGPHSPMDVTASMRERWQDVQFPLPYANDEPDRGGLLRNRQNYAAMIENIDWHVGQYLDLLEERDEAERTLVIYASDHGEMLGDHGRWGKSTYYEASTGIPLIVAGPGVARERTTQALVSLHDLTATILEAANAEPLPEMDSQSLWPVLRGQCDAHREVLVSGLDDWRMATDGRIKLVLHKSEPAQLHDLEEDPLEMVNVSMERAEETERLRDALDERTGFVGG